jgi:hypothetical protein
MKQMKFKPRDLNDEMPSVIIRNLSVYNCGGAGIHLNNTSALIDGYKCRKTKKPLEIEGNSRVTVRNPDFK